MKKALYRNVGCFFHAVQALMTLKAMESGQALNPLLKKHMRDSRKSQKIEKERKILK